MSAVNVPNTTTFRDLAAALSPPWLQGPVGSRILYSLAVQFDALADAATYAIRYRSPIYAPEDAIPYLQQDRLIDRGPNESLSSFRMRLTRYLDLWARAGLNRGIINALQSYLVTLSGSLQNSITIVAESARALNVTAWDTATGNQDPQTHYAATPYNWQWDQIYAPGRFWVIIGDNGQNLLTPSPNWAAFSWGDGTLYGCTAVAGYTQGIKNVVKKWKSAGSTAQVVYNYSSSYYVPTLTSGSPFLPNGTWGTWGYRQTSTLPFRQWGRVVGGVYVASSNLSTVGQTSSTYVPTRVPSTLYLGPTDNYYGVGAI